MNRIYQGKVTLVQIANPDKHAPRILSASNTVPRSRERERVVEDRVRDDGEKHSSAERTEVRCRNQNPWLPFDPDPKQAKAKWQSALLVASEQRGGGRVPSKPGEDGWQHHQLLRTR